MKAMKRQARILMMMLLLVGITACSSDTGEEMEYQMFGRTWAGDVGMNSNDGFPLDSQFHFDPDGFGEEYQYYRNGEFYRYYRFQWYWETPYSNNLILDYGREGISYMDDVYIDRRHMTGIFYLDDYSDGFPFTLEGW